MWTGASVSFGMRSKHCEAVVAFGDQARFVIYPSSPSHNGRALYNHVADVRHVLVELGAERSSVPKSSRPKSKRNPGVAMRDIGVGEPAPAMRDPWEVLQELAGAPLITAPGAYSGIDTADYHRTPHRRPAAAISASGLKTLLHRSPAHYWFDSPLNPNRPPEKDKPHFNVGKAAHDMLLLSERWPECYHVLPEGFSRAKSKAMASEIAEADAAQDAGKTLLSADDAELVHAMAAAIRANRLATAVLSNGESEVTLCWRDEATGVWLRARPDFLPHKRLIIPDLKTAADASPRAFQRAIANLGYAMAAALYIDGIAAVYGTRPTNWLHVVVEKEPPHVVALYELPAEDIQRGRHLCRRAINRFAECLSADRWPGYSDEPSPLGLPGWERRQIDEGVDNSPHFVAWGGAA